MADWEDKLIRGVAVPLRELGKWGYRRGQDVDALLKESYKTAVGAAQKTGEIVGKTAAAIRTGEVPARPVKPKITTGGGTDDYFSKRPTGDTVEGMIAEQEAFAGGREGTLMPGPAGERGIRKEFTDGGVVYAGDRGGVMRGQGVGAGGSFRVQGGPRGGMSEADWNNLSQEEATAIRVAELDAQRQGIRDLRNARRSAQGMPEVGTRREDMSDEDVFGKPTWDEALQDYAAGRAGSQGYNMVRNMRVGFGNDMDRARRSSQVPRTQRAAMAAVAGEYGDLLKGLGNGPQNQIGQPDYGDLVDTQKLQLDVAKFGASQKRADQEAARAQETLGLKRAEYELNKDKTGFDQMVNVNELAQGWMESAPMLVPEDLDLEPEQLQNLVSGAWNAGGGDPNAARVALDELIKQLRAQQS